ncbi:MAG: glycosyltransferase family 39 protein [Pyrinomonadaceae bacterium]
MPNPKILFRTVLIAIGLGVMCFAAVVSNTSYAGVLLGENAKDLSFGPPLFRALLLFHGALLIVIGLLWKGRASNPGEREATGITRLSWIALSVLTLLALGLRLWNLNSGLWVDEFFTLLDFVRAPIGEILTSFPSQNQHMLYSILANFSIGIFGESAWSLRLPAVLFGVASIVALFWFGKELIGEKEAILACALMTVSYHHVWFSQNARGYTGLLFFTILATWLWIKALKQNGWIWWVAYTAAVVGGMWVHMTMAFVIAAHGLVHIALLAFPRLSGEQISLERKAGAKPFVAWVLSVTVTMQLYALALPEFLRTGLHEESRNSEWTNPIWVLTEILQNLSIGFAGIAVVLVGAAFFAFGWYRLFKKDRRSAVLMVLPPCFAGSLMMALGHNLFPRFFFFAMGFGLIIAIYGAIELPKVAARLIDRSANKWRLPQLAGYALMVVMIAVSLTTVPRNYSLPKQDFSGAKEFVDANRLPDDKVVAVSIAGDIYERYFTSQWPVAKTGAELAAIEKDHERVWLIYTLSLEIETFRPEVWRMIQSDYKTIKIFPGTLNGGEIFVCQRRKIDEVGNESSKFVAVSENNSF